MFQLVCILTLGVGTIMDTHGGEFQITVFTGDIADEDWHPTDYFIMEYVLPSSEGPGPIDPEFVINVSILAVLVLPISFILVRNRFKR